jgi:tetratricopeptide (TPR) repeat protein
MGDRKIGINVDGDGNVIRENTIIVEPQKPPDRTSNEPPNNLEARGIDRDRFVGRDDVLQDLHARLQRSERVAIASVAGMGGVGKSELAVQYGRRHLAETYRGGVVWLAGERAGLELLSFARSTFFPTVDFSQFGDLREQLAFCWAHWPAKEVPPESVLLIFDDVTDYAAQVQPCLPSDGRFRVMVTTREKLDAKKLGIDRLDLAVLKPLAAIRLLTLWIGRDRVCQEARIARDLLKWLGYLPLAIELVGSLLAIEPDLTIAKLFEQLKTERLRHEAIEPIEVAFNVSWQRLSDAAKQMAMGLSVFANAPIPWELVERTIAGCKLDDTPKPERKRDKLRRWLKREAPPTVKQWCLLLDEKARRQARRELERLHLLDRVSEGRYGLHPLIREFFAVKLAARSEATDWRRSFARVMTAIARQIPQTVTISQQAELKEAIVHLAAATEYSDLLSAENYEWGWPFEGLARFYEAQSLFIEAETYSQQCLDQSETRFGADHPDTATSLNNLALLYKSQGKYESAEPLLQRALDIHERQLGTDHPHTALSLNSLAELYRVQGKYESAEPLLQRALDIRERQLGADHPSTSLNLNNLASLYESQGKYESAEPLLQRTLDIQERQLGADHPSTATSLNNLAELYRVQGKYESAEPLYQRALDIRERQLGTDHPDTASSLSGLAVLYRSQGKYETTEPLLQRALDITERQLGADHPHTALSLNNLAALYYSQGKYESAEPLYQRALDICERQLGADHPHTALSLNNLAELYQAQGKYESAEPLYQRALDIWEQQLGADHPLTATSLNNLAVLYCYQARWGEAERLLVRALLIGVQKLGEAHPDTQRSIRSLASLIQDAIEQNRTAELSDHPLTQHLLAQLRTNEH